jgi:hypothetical protein
MVPPTNEVDGDGRRFREWVSSLTKAGQNNLLSVARNVFRRRVAPEYRQFANDYVHTAFVEWWNKPRPLRNLRPGLLGRTAVLRFLSDRRRNSRLVLMDYETAISDHVTITDPTPPWAQNIETRQHRMAIAKAVQQVLTLEELQLVRIVYIQELYRGSSIDNRKLAEALGKDLDYVRNKIENMRKRLSRRGFSINMVVESMSLRCDVTCHTASTCPRRQSHRPDCPRRHC